MSGVLRGVDVWGDGSRMETLRPTCVEAQNTHGTGCTLSAAIAAQLALGADPFQATQQGKTYVTAALAHALDIGQGQGPVGHFFPLLNRP